MPFQLDTRMYGGSGGGGEERRPQRSQLGMLGELMDFKARKANARGIQESRDYVNEQRQQAIEKARREASDTEKLRNMPIGATLEDMVKAGVGYERASTFIDQRDKHLNARDVERRKKISSTAQGAFAYTDPVAQAAYWDKGQQDLIRDGHLAPEQVTPWSPETGQAAIDWAKTPTEYESAKTAKENAKNAAAAEKRLREKADREAAGETADTAMKVRVQFIPHLQTAPNREAYEHIYKQYPEAFRGNVPTADEAFGKDRAGALRRLDRLALTPEQYEANRDRDLDRAQRAAQHAADQKRLAAQAGVTPAMRQSALKTRNNDTQQLNVEKARRASEGTAPMTELEELQRLTQIERNYRSETHDAPDLQLAEGLKDASLKELEGRITKRMQPGPPDAQGRATPARPMTEAVINAEKLAILNRYRADHDLGPVTTLPPEWKGGATPSDTPQDGTLGALANTTPPKVQPRPVPAPAPPLGAAAPAGAPAPPPAAPRSLRPAPPPLPGSPASQDPKAAQEAATLSQEMERSKVPNPTPSQVEAMRNLRTRYRQLTGR